MPNGLSSGNDVPLALIAIWLAQAALTALACFWLWRLWRSQCDRRGLLASFVTAGFLIRAAGGQVLFWLSFLGLPPGRSLQIGRGLWFFALDASLYFDSAIETAAHGTGLLASGRIPSPFFIEMAAGGILLFGAVTSIAILLNCALYLGTCSLIGFLGRRHPTAEVPALVAVAFLSFTPSSILWSLQLLKDASTVFLVVAFVAACARWEDSIDGVDTTRRSARVAGLIALLAALIYAISGIRWYIAATLWGAIPLFALALVAVSRRKLFAALSGLVAFVVLAPPMIVSAGSAMPPPIRRLLHPFSVAAPNLAGDSIRSVKQLREAFDTTHGGTTILEGPLLAGGRHRAPSLPTTPSHKLIAGTTAAFLPRAVGQAAGIVRIGGGRGMWLVSEVDTLLLDGLLAWAAWSCFRSLRRSRSIPSSFVLVAGSCLMLTLPLAYGVSNFGTLFRLRYTPAVEIALLPVVAAGSRRREERT